MNPLTILALVLGLILLVTMPVDMLAMRAVLAGRAQRGGKVGIRTPETNASDGAWMAGHRAAYALRWKVLLMEAAPVIVGMVVGFSVPWLGVVLVMLGIPALVLGTKWYTDEARRSALAASGTTE